MLQEVFIKEFGHIARGELLGGIPVSLIFDGRDRLTEVKLTVSARPTPRRRY